MKQILKTNDRKAVESFESQLYYQAAYETGNHRACITHYSIKGADGYEEIAQISYNFNTKMYIIRY